MRQADLLVKIVSVLKQMDVTYMLVGSYASLAWGEARYTQDIDIVVSLIPEDAAVLVRAFPSPEYYVSSDAIGEAIRTGGQFNVIHPESGNKIDFMLARKDAWGRMQLTRRKVVIMEGGTHVNIAAAEDVILGKMLYYRQGGSDKHLRDITGILKVSGSDVDYEYVYQWAENLHILDIWQSILKRLGQ